MRTISSTAVVPFDYCSASDAAMEQSDGKNAGSASRVHGCAMELSMVSHHTLQMPYGSCKVPNRYVVISNSSVSRRLQDIQQIMDM